jgi:hypothetical protein
MATILCAFGGVAAVAAMAIQSTGDSWTACRVWAVACALQGAGILIEK